MNKNCLIFSEYNKVFIMRLDYCSSVSNEEKILNTEKKQNLLQFRDGCYLS